MKDERHVMLLVEDNKSERVLFRTALEQIGAPFKIFEVQNGAEAIRYLDGEGLYADRIRFPFPSNIVLDLKMPGVDGFAVLQHLRKHETWSVIPVIVFS